MIKVKLYKKALKNNKISLFLDFYPPIINNEGKLTRREYLHRYIYAKPKHSFEKEHNKDTLLFAQTIQHQRQNELNKPEIYTAFELERKRIAERNKADFIKYFKNLADKRKGSTQNNWISAYKHFVAFVGKNECEFGKLNEKLCNDFRDYLLNNESISRNTAVSYLGKFKATLKQAYRDKFLSNDINSFLDNIKPEETHRNFLTLEELRTLARTHCKSPLLKRVALFSALTGLRYSDIEKLTWGEIYSVQDGAYIQFVQQKTKGSEVLPISEEALGLLGERKQPEDKVFQGLTYSAYENKKLKAWITEAGIQKSITFHCFRHTYATLQFSEGTDIYTVSKLLGHKNVRTTQIYTKVIDQKKIEAANKIKIGL